jgi:cytochrome c oxidase cbb3-type subunit 2
MLRLGSGRQSGSETMNNGAVLFLGILLTLASSFWGLLLAPQLQIGRAQPVVIEATGQPYPTPRPGLAQQGAEVYRAQGCAECHTRQVRQTGVSFELWLADAGAERSQLAATMARLKIPDAEKAMAQAPVKLLSGLTMAEAAGFAQQLTNGEAKAQAVLATLGPDLQRGWGKRATVTQDYLYDYPVQLGNLRVGPDLANYGARAAALPTALVFQHLYAPQSTMPKSMMPPYRYLFNRRKLNEGEKPGPGALPANLAPGFEITPKPEAEALVAYLTSLNADAPLVEAPVPAPPVKAVPPAAPPAP